jgi:hypothetical protein
MPVSLSSLYAASASHDEVTDALALAAAYNVICKDFTPFHDFNSDKLIMWLRGMALVNGVDATSPEIVQEVAGKMVRLITVVSSLPHGHPSVIRVQTHKT